MCRNHQSFIAQMVQQYNNFTHNVKSHAGGEYPPLWVGRGVRDPKRSKEDNTWQDEKELQTLLKLIATPWKGGKLWNMCSEIFLSPSCRTQRTIVNRRSQFCQRTLTGKKKELHQMSATDGITGPITWPLTLSLFPKPRLGLRPKNVFAGLGLGFTLYLWPFGATAAQKKGAKRHRKRCKLWKHYDQSVFERYRKRMKAVSLLFLVVSCCFFFSCLLLRTIRQTNLSHDGCMMLFTARLEPTRMRW